MFVVQADGRGVNRRVPCDVAMASTKRGEVEEKKEGRWFDAVASEEDRARGGS